MRFVWGIVWILIGMGLIRYTFQITNLFGKVGWAETHMDGGLGGTYTMWKIVGVLVIVFAMLYMFNAIGFILSPLGSVFGGGNK